MSETTLYHGDCLIEMNKIVDNSVDMILCDLPYGTTACSWDVVIPFEDLWKQYNRIIKDNGAIVLFGSEPFSSLLRMSNLKMYKYDWIWDKKKAGNILNAKRQPMKVHEIISVFSKGKTNYYPIKTPQKERKGKATKVSDICGDFKLKEFTYTDKYPTSIQTFSNANNKNKMHPTQKPTDLLEYLIKTYTLENETVLDNTMGSGSTGVACVNTNRNFIGIELDDNYFKIAEDRINKAKETIFEL